MSYQSLQIKNEIGIKKWRSKCYFFRSLHLTGENLEQITYDDAFDSFPMFSHDGKMIVFSSNRNNNGTRSTNLFIADWVESVN